MSEYCAKPGGNSGAPMKGSKPKHLSHVPDHALDASSKGSPSFSMSHDMLMHSKGRMGGRED